MQIKKKKKKKVLGEFGNFLKKLGLGAPIAHSKW